LIPLPPPSLPRSRHVLAVVVAMLLASFLWEKGRPGVPLT
jgi:hypothetical protein